MAQGRVYARIPFQYGKDQRGKPRFLDRGEIIELVATAKRNSQLINLGYLLPYNPASHTSTKCDMCGKRFIGYQHLTSHKKKPTCLDDQSEIKGIGAEITRQETAALLDTDVKNVGD